MRRAICCLLVVLLGSWLSSFGQTVPKFTSPRIVATFERLGLTAELPPTTIYTPKNWGTFRVSIVMVLTLGNVRNSGYWMGGLQFADGAGENFPGDPFDAILYANTRRTGAKEVPIRAKAGKPIKFSVTAPQGGTEGSKYNVWVVVEQLM